MEKLEQEMNAPEKMAETPSPKKTAGKKKKFRKNQVIITALAIMIAVAGYINYADSTLSTKEKADGTTADASTVLKDISSLDTDITDEVDAGTAGDSSRTVTETPGEAVLAGASTYMAQARIDREQIRSQNKDTLNEIINNTALAIMIAVAGYINYADSTLSTKEKADGTTADASTVLKDISSLDTDITDEVDAGTAGDSSRTVTETPGEAVLAGASTYMAQARIDREQIRSQNKDTLNEIINNTNLSETERQSAVQSMVEMTELVEKESATELLLEAKGFTDVVVNLTGETADIVVPMKEVTEEQRAQIEDIVTRKTGIGVENIVITPMSSAADTAAEESAQ